VRNNENEVYGFNTSLTYIHRLTIRLQTICKIHILVS